MTELGVHMGLSEPNGPLWGAVTAIYDAWPPDDEMTAFDLGRTWQRGAAVVNTGARMTAAAGGDAVAVWQDTAGEAFGGRVDEFTSAASELESSMGDLAARADHYGRELESAKITITATVAANESAYALLGNPLLGAVGPALRLAFAGIIATNLRAMIDAKAAALRAGPAPAAPAQNSTQNSAEDTDSGNWLLDTIGDTGRALGDGVLEIGRVVGTAANAVSDTVGVAADAALDAVGLDEKGDKVRDVTDDFGDTLLEGALTLGAAHRNEAYDVAQAFDGTDNPRTVYISYDKYKDAAQHIDEAKGGTTWRGFESTRGEPRNPVLTVDREESERRRNAAVNVVPSRSDYDRDEYPPAVAKEGGPGSSVKYIDPSDNRGAGSTMGNQLNGKTKSIERQLGGGLFGYGKADDGDKFILETF